MNCCAGLPLHTATWTTVPLAVPPQVASMHRPSERIVPSGRKSHFCQFFPVQSAICSGAPSRHLWPATSMQRFEAWP